MKQVMVHFEFPTGTVEQYDQVWNDLRATGNDHPKGLVFHVGAPIGTGFMVTDVWESEEDFTEFSEVLRPILEKNQVPTDVMPTISPARYVYEGIHSPTV